MRFSSSWVVVPKLLWTATGALQCNEHSLEKCHEWQWKFSPCSGFRVLPERRTKATWWNLSSNLHLSDGMSILLDSKLVCHASRAAIHWPIVFCILTIVACILEGTLRDQVVDFWHMRHTLGNAWTCPRNYWETWHQLNWLGIHAHVEMWDLQPKLLTILLNMYHITRFAIPQASLCKQPLLRREGAAYASRCNSPRFLGLRLCSDNSCNRCVHCPVQGQRSYLRSLSEIIFQSTKETVNLIV